MTGRIWGIRRWIQRLRGKWNKGGCGTNLGYGTDSGGGLGVLNDKHEGIALYPVDFLHEGVVVGKHQTIATPTL